MPARPSVVWQLGHNGPDWFWRYNSPLVAGQTWLDLMSDPMAWISQSHSLRDAADLLEPHIAVHNPVDERGVYRGTMVATQHMMLCGMAMECALKARYLDKGGAVARDRSGKLKFPELQGASKHDLHQMAQSARLDLQLDNADSLLLKWLSLAIEFGRYPAFLQEDRSLAALGTGVDWSLGHVRLFGTLRNRVIRDISRNR